MIEDISICTINQDTSLWGIVFFLIIILVGIALVSVHYRKKYEEAKAKNIKAMNILRRCLKIIGEKNGSRINNNNK